MQNKSLFQLAGFVVLELVLLYLILIYLEKIFGGLGTLLTTISPVIVGISIAYLLNRPISRLYQLIKSRLLSIVLVFLVMLIILILVGTFFVPLVIKNFQDLFDFLLSTVSLDLIMIDIADQFGAGVTVFTPYIFSFTSSLLNLICSLVVAFYLLLRKDHLLLLLKHLFRPLFGVKFYPIIASYAVKSDRIFYRFIGAQLLDAAILGTLATVVLLIIGIPYAVVFGLLIGICNMIPIFGSIFATLITVVVTFFTTGLSVAIVTLVVLFILQQIDANIIGPKITGDALGLKPLLIIFAIFVGNHYFGLIGMFLGVPVVAMVKLLIMDLMDYQEKTK